MGFIRVKRISNNRYAYLVENSWKRKGPRQKVKGYLGRVFAFDEERSIDFWSFAGSDPEAYEKDKGAREMIRDAARFELAKRGFREKVPGAMMEKESVMVDLKIGSIMKKNANVVIEMNEGFMCGSTLQSLLNTMLSGSDLQEKGYNLAKAFVDAGLKVPEDLFVLVFRKMEKEAGK